MGHPVLFQLPYLHWGDRPLEDTTAILGTSLSVADLAVTAMRWQFLPQVTA